MVFSVPSLISCKKSCTPGSPKGSDCARSGSCGLLRGNAQGHTGIMVVVVKWGGFSFTAGRLISWHWRATSEPRLSISRLLYHGTRETCYCRCRCPAVGRAQVGVNWLQRYHNSAFFFYTLAKCSFLFFDKICTYFRASWRLTFYLYFPCSPRLST